MATTTVTTETAERALHLAARGWQLFPVEPSGKRPLISDWPHQATNDPDRLQFYLRRFPGCNWGATAGKASRFFVLDVDGPDGMQSLQDLETRNFALPTTTIVRTARGAHIYFQYPLDGQVIRNSAGKIASGLDIRGEGGYVIVPPSVHAGGTSYEFVNEDVSIAPAPPWLLEMLAQPATVQLPSTAPQNTKANAIPAGQRNETLMRLAGSMRRNGMTEPAIAAALSAENVARCEPPLTEQEVRQIARSASRYEPASTDNRRESLELIREWPDSLLPDALYGLAGELVRAMQPYTEADPAAHLAQLLVAFGNAIGRRAFFQVEEDMHFSNEFLVLVGATSKARKGTSWTPVRRALEAVDPSWAARVMPGLSSGEGVIHQVRDAHGDGRGDEDEDDPGEPDKRLMVVEPEFASVLAAMARQGNTLSAVLRQAWDGARLGNLTKNSSESCSAPHISVVAHITVEELRRHMNCTELANGFANRFLFTCVRRSKQLPDGARMPEELRESLSGRLNAAVTFARSAGQMARDAEAKELWHLVYGPLSDGHSGMFGAVTGRAEAHVLRLSCLYALLDHRVVIGAEHLRAALAFWKYAEESARYIFGDSIGDPVADAILQALRKSPEGLTRTAISQLFSNNQNRRRLSAGLALLESEGRAHAIKQESEEGRPSEIWFYGPTKKTN